MAIANTYSAKKAKFRNATHNNLRVHEGMTMTILKRYKL